MTGFRKAASEDIASVVSIYQKIHEEERKGRKIRQEMLLNGKNYLCLRKKGRLRRQQLSTKVR